MFLMLIAVCSVIFVCMAYFGLIRHLTRRTGWRVFWGAIAAILGASFVWAMRGRRLIQPDSGSYDLVTLGFYAMLVATVIGCLILFRDILVCVWDLWRMGVRLRQKKKAGDEQDKTENDTQDVVIKEKNSQKTDDASLPSLTRRQFILRTSSYGILAGTAALSPPAVWMAKCGRRVRKVDLTFERWPSALEGFRIVHLSDIHAGNTITKNDISDIVDETNALDPDLIVITGDIADGQPKFVAPLLEPMRRFKARHGVFYVTGNHEHMWGGRAWCRAVAALGITVLDNAHRVVTANGVSFAVAGATDIYGERREKGWKSDPAAALANIPEEMFRLMLVHQPASVDASFAHGADLVLLGHTHGGQFWPACYIVDMVHKYARGLYRVGNKAAFVSCGTGYWGPPIRLGVPPEIALVTLGHA